MLEHRMLLALLALVLLARILGKLLSGFLVRATIDTARPAGAWLGIVLLSSGPVSTACGFAFALRFPGPVGDTLLICAVAAALLGELVSTLSLKAMLTETGEIVQSPTTIPPRAPSGPPPRSSVIPPSLPIPPASSVQAFTNSPDQDEDPAA
jgi:hypothetical protein